MHPCSITLKATFRLGERSNSKGGSVPLVDATHEVIILVIFESQGYVNASRELPYEHGAARVAYATNDVVILYTN